MVWEEKKMVPLAVMTMTNPLRACEGNQREFRETVLLKNVEERKMI